MLADIPGLIEGAAEGAGLGHEFLAHLERCRLLVHLVEVAPSEGDPEASYETVRGELVGYGAGLDGLPEIIALSKVDLIPEEEARRRSSEWGERRSGRGRGAWHLIRDRRRPRPADPGDLRVAARRVGRAGRGATRSSTPSTASTAPETRRASTSSPEGDGRFRVTGRGIELLIARHDLENPEALDYLEKRLREIGVIAALQRAGFEPGDEVVVGDLEFELRP